MTKPWKLRASVFDIKGRVCAKQHCWISNLYCNVIFVIKNRLILVYLSDRSAATVDKLLYFSSKPSIIIETDDLSVRIETQNERK